MSVDPRSLQISPPFDLSPAARALLLPVLAEISWADGHVSLPERSAARGAALALGILDPLDPVCAGLLAKDEPVSALALLSVASQERELLVACAAWMALADGVETPLETAGVRALADRARLSHATADRLVGAARWVRTVSPSYLTWRQEMLVLLRTCAAHSTAAPDTSDTSDEEGRR